MLESLFNKVAGLWACNFIKISLRHRCFPAKFAKFLRKPILKNICERLLLLAALPLPPTLLETGCVSVIQLHLRCNVARHSECITTTTVYCHWKV